MRTRDRRVPVPSLIALGIAAWLGASASVARACPVSGIYGRSTWPAPGTSVPTNARFVVTYSSDSADPKVGPDLALVDAADGTIVPTMTSTPYALWQVVVRPSAPLKPNHAYHLADRHSLPCILPGGGCDPSATLAMFASFTTTGADDTTAPTFAGLRSITWGQRQVPCTGTCCLASYESYEVILSWPDATDDVANAVSYNVYRRDQATGTAKLVGGFLPPGDLRGTVVVSGTPPPWSTLEYGTYSVRAVDWAGNEDKNERTLELSANMKPDTGGGCTVSGASGPPLLGLALLALALAATVAARPACAASRARRG
jgi:hypothetical protein